MPAPAATNSNTMVPGFEDALRYTNTKALGISPGSADMNPDQQRNFLASIKAGKMSASGASPTVLSDSNIRENVIPSLTNKAANLSPTSTSLSTVPKTTDEAGMSDGKDSNSYGVDSGDLDYSHIYEKVFGAEDAKTRDPDIQRSLDTLEAMRTTKDSAFQGQISTIKDQFETNKNLLEETQRGQLAAERHMLLKTGSYRTSSESSAPALVRTHQINDLANLQIKENDAIAKVKAAQSDSDYKTMQEEMKILDKVRSDKRALATKISGELLKANEKYSKDKEQTNIDNAVADAISSGMTDPSEILKEVTGKGMNVNTADIEKSLNTIAKANNMDLQGLSGNVKNFFALKDSGALPATVKSLPEDQQLKAFLDMEHSSTKKTDTTTKPLYTTTSGTAVTKSDISAGVQKLDDSKNENGYSDPKLYLAMYQYWENEGLSPAEFIKQYPPKYYIDPTDTTLPPYLRPATTKGKGTTISNPFGPTVPAK